MTWPPRVAAAMAAPAQEAGRGTTAVTAPGERPAVSIATCDDPALASHSATCSETTIASMRNTQTYEKPCLQRKSGICSNAKTLTLIDPSCTSETTLYRKVCTTIRARKISLLSNLNQCKSEFLFLQWRKSHRAGGRASSQVVGTSWEEGQWARVNIPPSRRQGPLKPVHGCRSSLHASPGVPSNSTT